MITGRQIRAARGLLRWRVEDLSQKSGLTREAITRIEEGSVQPREGSLAKISKAFDQHGVEFIDNQGVRFKPNDIEVFEGPERFDDFYDFLYEHLKRFGGEVCIGNSDPQLYIKYHKGFLAHKQRMEELVEHGSIRFRILIKEGDQNFTASSYAQYRWQAAKSFVPMSFYAFGECLALISFVHTPAPYIILIKSGPLAEAYRQAFNLAWEEALIPSNKKEE